MMWSWISQDPTVLLAEDGEDYGKVVITTVETCSHELDSVPQILSLLIKMS